MSIEEKNRVEKIDNILEQRRPVAGKIEKVIKNLNSLSFNLTKLDIMKNNIAENAEDDIKGRLKEINVQNIQNSIISEINNLNKIKSRFSRDTLNIGVVGRARTGKSRLLQSLTGLTSEEIPDGNRLHCTGVRSSIYHNPDIETYGEVFFHTEQSFLDEVIAPYYEELRLGMRPFSLKDFSENELPPLSENSPFYADPRAKYEHLRNYYSNFTRYANLLGKAPLRISKGQIREYVAQDTQGGERIYFNYLSVREVKIVCKYPSSGAGKIALIDMPGLGDTGIGDEERLIKILGENIDIVLFVRMPKSSGDFWADVDVKLYDTARSSLVNLPVDLWSFMILNRTGKNSENGDNSNNCIDLAETIGKHHIKVLDSLIVDCADLNSVQTKILDKILDYMADNISSLDKRYSATCQDNLNQLHRLVYSEIDKCRKALGEVKTSTSEEFILFRRLFDGIWTELTNGLEHLLRELRPERDSKESPFKSRLAKVLDICNEKRGIPDINQIEVRRHTEGSYDIVYNKYLHEMRTDITGQFLLLDEGLKETLDKKRTLVAKILSEKGKVGEFIKSDGPLFLEDFFNILPERLSKLRLGFEIITAFNLSYRGLIHHRIRKLLDCFVPDETDQKLSRQPSAKDVRVNLERLYGRVLYEIESETEKFLCEPNQSAFCMVEEFIDRVIRSEGVKSEWEEFYYDFRADIWSSEFARLGEKTRLRKSWDEVIEDVEKFNGIEDFRIS
jgi:hypothetical protein